MRYVLVAAIALVVGLVLGGMPARWQGHSLEAQLAAAKASKGSVGSELAGLFAGGPPVSAPPADDGNPGEKRRPFRKRWQERREHAEGEEAPVEDGEEIRIGDEEGEGEPADFNVMREALEVRRTQARAALIEQAGPSDEQLAAIDEAVAAMNDELMGLADDVVEQAQNGEEPERREMMVYAADALDILIGTDAKIRGALDADQLADLDDAAIDPFSYVDPALIDTFEELDR